MTMIVLPETLADVLVNASDAKELQAFDRLCLRSTKIKKRKPADYAFMLKEHYTDAQIEQFAEPFSKCDKDGKCYNFRGIAIVDTNRLPVFDVSFNTPKGANKPQRVEWFKRYVQRLPVGKELSDASDIYKVVKSAQSGTGQNAVDLSKLNTKVTFESRKVGTDGQPKLITKDVRDMTGDDIADYIRDCNAQLKDMADAYRNAIVLLRQWAEIRTRAEFKGKVELDWNYSDRSDPTSELHGNGLPFILYHMEEKEFDVNGTKVKQMVRSHVSTAISWEKLYDMDLDKAAAALSAPDNKSSVYRALLDNKFKKPDDAAGAGQGSTEDQKKRKSRIPVTGDGSMRDVLVEVVYFFRDGGTLAAFKNNAYNGMDAAERDDLFHSLREAYLLLRDVTGDEDVIAAHARVEKATAERDAAEKERKEKLEQERAANERAPTQADIWRAQEKARQDEANKVLASPPTEPEPAIVKTEPAATKSNKSTAARSNKQRAG